MVVVLSFCLIFVHVCDTDKDNNTVVT